MAIFKCKICGGALQIDDSQSVATCEYCGTKQTLPKLDDERRANLYDRANHFRRNNDFDKAMGMYENILNEDNTDAEAYWSIVLCRYGVEYVEDPSTHKHIPTINRAQFTSIFDDEDYKSAIANADEYQREIYEAEAAVINQIQKGILAISQKEEPFDIFICYKETDKNGRRTQDSALAAELYHELTREGFKVFFSRITVEDKLGVAYEPYIFAALHSAKVMVVLGTRPEHFDAVWVKNEWSRFLALIKSGKKKMLIPAYRDMNPYDLPEEFSHLQAQDMSKLGFMQDLIHAIKKIVELDKPKNAVTKRTVITGASAGIDPLFKRASMALADGEFERADAFYEQILNQDPENAEAYVGKLLSELRLKSQGELADSETSFENNSNYKKAIYFANADLKNELSCALQAVLIRVENRKNEEIYRKAKHLLENPQDIPTCRKARRLFLSVSGYLDADFCAEICQKRIEEFQEAWEQLRLEQQKAREEQQIAAKKAKKLFFAIGTPVLILFFISIAAYISIFRIVIPNSQYLNAIALIEEQKYDEAIDLLEEAKEDAFFANTIAKIEETIKSTKVLEQKLSNSITSIESSGYNKAVIDLLSSGVSVELIYQTEGGTLVDNGDTFEQTRFLYKTLDSFDRIVDCLLVGYRFTGWSCEGYRYRYSDQVFELTMVANFSKIEYAIWYNLDGGTATNPTEYDIDDDPFTLTAPSKTGYTFVGWTGTDLTRPTMNITILTGSYGIRSYTANWEANKYSVSFDVAGGNSAVPNATYTYNKSVALPTPQRDGYTFAGWYNGTQRVSNGAWKITENVTLVAKWNPVPYTITYNLGNVPASNPNQTKFTVNTNTIALMNLSHENYTFEGWYSDSNFTNRVTTIPRGTQGNITLYAKWTIK